MTPAFTVPYYEPGGWIILALMLPGLIVLVGVVFRFLIAKPSQPQAKPQYFHVMGLDRVSGQPREATFHAADQASAAGQAHLAGIVVTEINPATEVEVTEEKPT